MEETIKAINAVMYTLDSIHIKGRITENAAAYNDIIGCINSLAQVIATLQKPEDDGNAEDQTE